MLYRKGTHSGDTLCWGLHHRCHSIFTHSIDMHTGSGAMSDGAGADVDRLCEVQLHALTMGPTHFVLYPSSRRKSCPPDSQSCLCVLLRDSNHAARQCYIYSKLSGQNTASTTKDSATWKKDLPLTACCMAQVVAPRCEPANCLFVTRSERFEQGRCIFGIDRTIFHWLDVNRVQVAHNCL